MAELAVIILAAGKGTRMKSDLPKVLHKVAGKAMVSHVLAAADKLGAVKKIVVVAPDADAVVKEVKGAETVVQKSQLGTGDAVNAAKDALASFGGNVLVLYGDCPLVTAESIKPIIEAPLNGEIRMFGFNAKDPAKYGRLVAQGDEVSEIVEFKDASEEQRKITLCNSGIYYLNSKLLFELLAEVKNDNSQKEYYLTDIVKIARGKGIKTKAVLIDEAEVSGVNDKGELASAESVLQQRLRKQAMLDGVTLIAPETVFLSADTKFGRNVTIRPNVVIGENVVVGDNVAIGPFAHIRPGTVLGNGAKIGNFVEIKKSKIGDGAKVSHLSYIGDATLGDDVNIGAGTITCNYDGYNKYQTEIEAGAFIGSNSALVAPVKVGEGAIVAAGSVITKDVPANSLGLARSLQKNLADWALKFKKDKK